MRSSEVTLPAALGAGGSSRGAWWGGARAGYPFLQRLAGRLANAIGPHKTNKQRCSLGAGPPSAQ